MQHVVKSLEPVNSFIFWNLIGPCSFLIGQLSLVVGTGTVSPLSAGMGGLPGEGSAGHMGLCSHKKPRCSSWSPPDALYSLLSCLGSSFTMREEVAWRGETVQSVHSRFSN